MIKHQETDDRLLWRLIRQKKICFGGNARLKIYGKLSCKSGKKMKKENRVFFATEEDALAAGFRPCGHCMKDAYLNWKKV